MPNKWLHDMKNGHSRAKGKVLQKSIKNIIKEQVSIYGILVALILPVTALAEPVAVIYPSIREPFDSIFKEIINGVEKSVSKVKKYRLKKDDTAEKLQKWLQKKKITTVVALGKQGVQISKDLPNDIAVVYGAVLLPQNINKGNVQGITLSPAPKKLFSTLREFSKKVKTIYVIYGEENNAWLVNHAKLAAAEMGFTLKAMPASSLTESANYYRDLLSQPLSGSDAIWLLQDRSTIDSKTILPSLLDKAWEKKFIVFSSNPAYVKRGILFSLFPDNGNMGKSLGEIVNRIQKGNPEAASEAMPLKDLKIAVNLRAAEHLGLNFDKSTERGFDLVFPPRH